MQPCPIRAFGPSFPLSRCDTSAWLALHKSTSLMAPPSSDIHPPAIQLFSLAEFIVPSRLVEESMSPKQTMLLIANRRKGVGAVGRGGQRSGQRLGFRPKLRLLMGGQRICSEYFVPTFVMIYHELFKVSRGQKSIVTSIVVDIILIICISGDLLSRI